MLSGDAVAVIGLDLFDVFFEGYRHNSPLPWNLVDLILILHKLIVYEIGLAGWLKQNTKNAKWA